MCREKKIKICESPKEDRISQLPEPLISEILCQLSTKDAVRTSVLSTRWRSLWEWVPELDLDSSKFSNFDAFVSFADRFFDSNKESWIRKLRCLRATVSSPKNFQIINSVFSGRLDIDISYNTGIISESVICDILTNISRVRDLVISRRTWKKIFAYSKSGPVPKDYCGILQFRNLSHFNIRFYISDLETLPTLLESCPKLESLILELVEDPYMIGKKKKEPKVIFSKVPQCLVSSLKFVEWKRSISGYEGEMELDIVLYSKSGPVQQFRNLSSLNASFTKSDLELLPLILKSCPKLESLTLVLVNEQYMRRGKKKDPKVVFSAVPQCLVSSLKFVELKRLISGYEGETELIRYFLKNSIILKKLRLDLYYSKSAMSDFLRELVEMPRCSTGVEVRVL
ncbi:unnamed protein product [Arabidopsis thaliana]|uniref:F-box domain-containing protein n=1 Tax=Arabidopsis thaliana TaxID=3702 RepID=A0A5S9YDP6_ARATH|nr:unnamed protein product [Arabidopsis thaliana]